MSEELERLSRAAETNALHRTVEVGTAAVRRPAGPATATVHSYLRHLRARVRAFLDAYGPAGIRVEDVVDEVVACVARTAALELDLARRGVEPQRSWVADGSQEAAAAEIRWLLDNRALVDPPP